ncbi:unnamed protein product [Pneumocystis jirovecii]|uniref:C3H1-type domain-containing protein n=1 Tax=Pneumocystis jirovecii TaxID=42068 RepID=L0PC20_PNEJI|nr:unnamed protein product [Pneumocystis jirovecii]CCJ29654.1 unnamed protein product [Pneumocystis jirovecii]
MLFEEKDSKALKTYLLKLLDPISNADLDVLSDYILALLRHDQSSEDVKKLCLSQLEEFLRENTFSFVDDVFNALEKKTYLDEIIQVKDLSAEEKEVVKKRSFHETFLDTGRHQINNGKRSRFLKLPHMNYYGNSKSSYHQKAWLSDMFPFSSDFPMNSNRRRCKDYEERGYCMRGDMCPYDHGVDHIFLVNMIIDAYDPTQSILTNHSMGTMQSKPIYKNLTRNNKERFKNYRRNYSCSIQGPNYDKTITTLIVENIPSNDLNEENIHQFFKKFGEISKITVEKDDYRAILKFKDWKSANKAWSSSAPIFNNRFVKLFWKMSETNNKKELQENNQLFSNTFQKPVVDNFSKDEFMEKIEIKQKEHKEREQKKKENAKAREMLQKKEELIQKQLQEKRNLIALMSKNTNISESSQEKAYNTDKSSTLSKKALEIQLAALKAEADNLGISIDTESLKTNEKSWNNKSNFHRKSIKNFKPYSKKKPSFYYGSMQLDNHSDKDEILRQHLLHNGEYEIIEKDPDDPDAQIIVFKDRRTAEKFLRVASTIPDMGNIKLKWKYDTIRNSENSSDHNNILEPMENRGSNGRGFYEDDEDTGEALIYDSNLKD